ncbi:MAG TPA: Ig-like domain-containing protein [Verrucomicrobiae bacterium]|nr:Ig-like domain-containing protein [Verrucomicrobiae bacterium]
MKRFFTALLALALLVAPLSTFLSVNALTPGPNLVPNASVETPKSGTPSSPQSWATNKWGTITASFTYENTGHTGSKSVKSTVTKYTTGDAKWYFTPVTIEPNKTYTFTDYYKSNVTTSVWVELENTSGALSYTNIGNPAASATNWSTFTANYTAPANAKKATIYHVIDKVGWVQLDDQYFGLSDTTPSNPVAPTVSVTAPAANATVNGNVTLTASAASPGSTVAGVQFKVDGVNVGSEDLTAPYSVAWNTNTATAGAHNLTAVVRSNNGLTTTSTQVPVTVNNSPTVTVTAPAANATVSGTQNMTATATSPGSTVAGVQFKVDGVNVGAEDTTAPYSVAWNTTSYSNAGHTVSATVRSANGQTVTSTDVPVTVNNVAAAPTVTVTAPATNATVSNNVNITASAASPGSTVAGVQFKVDGVNVGSEDTSAPYSVSWDTKTATDGSHSVTAVVRSNNGLSTTSSAVVVNVNNPIAPTGSITAPTATSTVTDLQTITASAASPGSTVAGVQFKVDGVNVGSEDTSAPYEASWDTKTVSNGSHTLTAVVRSTNGLSTTTTGVQVTVDNPVVVPPTDPTNLIPNPSMEITGSETTPTGWTSSKWGTNTAAFTSEPNGHTGRSVKSTMTAFTDGDAKWYFNPITAKANQQYTYKHFYQSTVSTELLAAYIDASNNWTFQWIKTVPASANWAEVSATFTTPANAKQLTVFHTIAGVGSLSLDDASLKEVATAPSTGPIANNSFENASANNPNLPANWTGSNWGTNTPVYEWLNEGHTGSKSAKVTVSNYVDGDAKWVFDEITTGTGANQLQRGKQYRFSSWYKSNTTPNAVVQFIKDNNTAQYYGMPNPQPGANAATTWQQYSDTFTVPVDAKTVTIFFYINGNGWVQTDDYNITDYTPVGFNRPLLTMTFDDGHEDNIANALPLLNQYGFKTTQCYMTGNGVLEGNPTAQQGVLSFFNSGHEICSHTVTHPMLTTLTEAQARYELEHSKQVLESIIGQPVLNFASPHGDYNANVNSIIDDYYQSHRTVDEGYNSKDNYNKYRVRVQNLQSTTTMAEFQSWITQAKATNTWLVLVYHRIANNPEQFDTKIADFQAQLQAIQASGITVSTYQSALTETQSQL